MKHRRNKKIIKKANEIVKEWAVKFYPEYHWIYRDFALNDRFIDEIKDDDEITVSTSTAQQLANYGIRQIKGNHAMNLLCGLEPL